MTIIAVFQLVQAAVLLVALFIAIRNPAPDSSIQLGVGRQLIPSVEVEEIAIAPIAAGVLIVLSVGLLWFREWARLVTILFAAIPVARFVIGFALVALIRPSRLSAGLNANLRVGLLFDLAILWYLLRDEVKKEFAFYLKRTSLRQIVGVNRHRNLSSYSRLR